MCSSAIWTTGSLLPIPAPQIKTPHPPAHLQGLHPVLRGGGRALGPRRPLVGRGDRLGRRRLVLLQGMVPRLERLGLLVGGRLPLLQRRLAAGQPLLAGGSRRLPLLHRRQALPQGIVLLGERLGHLAQPRLVAPAAGLGSCLLVGPGSPVGLELFHLVRQGGPLLLQRRLARGRRLVAALHLLLSGGNRRLLLPRGRLARRQRRAAALCLLLAGVDRRLLPLQRRQLGALPFQLGLPGRQLGLLLLELLQLQLAGLGGLVFGWWLRLGWGVRGW
jgi:hypothetical protein